VTHPDGSSSSLEARLERAERTIGALAAELSALRAEVRGAPALPRAQRSAAAPAQPKRPLPRPAIDVEQLVGRYGILAIAVVAAVAAVGTFLSWAIAKGYVTLGPSARVVIGLAASAALGAWGIRMRRRERSFGSTLLGLALVLVQVCAYGAGPKFHLVPPLVAFVGAALVSWVLAFFAHAENDEPLWCVGFGGAALAPFVTSDGGGSTIMLLSYGLLVLLPACFAISHRDWPVAWRVFYVVVGVYSFTGATLSRDAGTGAFAVAFAFPFIVMVGGIVPFAPESRKRGAMRWLAVLAVLVGLAENAGGGAERWSLMIGFLVAATLWLALIDRHAAVEQSTMVDTWRSRVALLDWIDAGIIPFAFVGEAANVLDRPPAMAFLAGVVLFTAFAWRRAVNSLRDAAAAAAVIAAVFALFDLAPERPFVLTVAIVALALATLAAHVIRPSVSWLGGCIALLLLAGGISLDALGGRAAYEFPLFQTEASATALAITIALVLVSRFWQSLRVSTRAAMGERPEWSYAQSARVLLRGATLAPWIWAFIWVLVELSMAYSPSTSTLLLVVYFAITGVGGVAVGRSRHSARLRQVGLVLAIIAAATAFYGASTYFDMGVRIVAYLVTSAFLLGIAYWYRRPGASPASPAATA
jgi:hypothetical protein